MMTSSFDITVSIADENVCVPDAAFTDLNPGAEAMFSVPTMTLLNSSSVPVFILTDNVPADLPLDLPSTPTSSRSAAKQTRVSLGAAIIGRANSPCAFEPPALHRLSKSPNLILTEPRDGSFSRESCNTIISIIADGFSDELLVQRFREYVPKRKDGTHILKS
jgi:hypothetical protein